MFKKFLTLLPILLLTSCAVNRNTELHDVLASKSNLESSFVTLIKTADGNVDQLSDAIAGVELYHKKETKDYTSLKSYIVSEQSVHEVDFVIYRLCKAIDGFPYKNACVDSSNHENILFFAKVNLRRIFTDTIVHNSQYGIDLFIIIPKLNGQKATLALANTVGYESPLQKEARERKIKEKSHLAKVREEEQRKAEEKREQERAKARERYLASLRRLSKQTRSLVLTKGTKICSVDGTQFNGFTQDISNGKIEINIDNRLVWDWAQNWYACDHKPQ